MQIIRTLLSTNICTSRNHRNHKTLYHEEPGLGCVVRRMTSKYSIRWTDRQQSTGVNIMHHYEPSPLCATCHTAR